MVAFIRDRWLKVGLYKGVSDPSLPMKCLLIYHSIRILAPGPACWRDRTQAILSFGLRGQIVIATRILSVGIRSAPLSVRLLDLR